MRQFQVAQRKARIREKRPRRALDEIRGDAPRSLETLLGLFSLVLAFSWAPWKCLKSAQDEGAPGESPLS